MRRAWLIVLVVATRTAHADEDLAAQGEAFAKAGDYSRAIDAFKAADKQHVRARNACMIGLAYLRRELWPQAEIFLTTCKERATAEDPLPDWFGEAEQQLVQKLAAANVAAVTVVIEPDVSTASVTVSSFAPDESFAPRTIHLAPGHHTLEIRAPGYEPESRRLDLTGRGSQRVVVTLYRPGQRPGPATSRAPLYMMAGGAALGVAAGAIALFSVKPLQDELASTDNKALYDADRDKFVLRRNITYGLAAGAGLAIVAGLVLRYTVFAPESPVRVVTMFERGGGTIAISFEH